MKKILLFLMFAFVVFGSNLFAQMDSYLESNEYYKLAVKAYQEGNKEELLNNLRAAESLRPNHPRLMFNLAASYALNDKKDSSLVMLNRISKMDLYFDTANDSDFVSLWEEIEYAVIRDRFDESLKPYGTSEYVLSYPENDLIVEDVAYNTETGVFYLSSVHKGKIVTVDEKELNGDLNSEHQIANAIDELLEKTAKMGYSLLGVEIDSDRHHLWVCGNVIRQLEGYDETRLNESAVLKFDLNTNKLIKEYKTDDEAEHLFGDLTIDDNGSVYISDSRYNAIYRITEDDDVLEPFIMPEYFASLQGIVFNAAEDALFAADYALGLFKIDMLTKNVELLDPAEDLTTLGIDGLYYYEGDLIAIQNGVNPARVIRIELNPDEDVITSYEVLERANEHFNDPTLGTIVGDEFYYVANSQWPAFDRDGTFKENYELTNPVILKVKLD